MNNEEIENVSKQLRELIDKRMKEMLKMWEDCGISSLVLSEENEIEEEIPESIGKSVIHYIQPYEPICECGAHKVVDNFHSNWCPIYINPK